MSEILNEFLKRTELEIEDRDRLKRERGFSDELISRSLFRSARPQNEAVIFELVKEFGQRAAAEVGLVVIRNNQPEATVKLLGIDKLGNREPNIIIPYLEGDECVALRPHKNFIKGKSLNIYYASSEYSEDATTIMTEGEFKARAATAFGYQAFAVPGISSFVGDKQAGKKFVEFYESLAIEGIRDIIIIFDNEDKSNPELPKYKEEPDKRYDVQYYAYLMCLKFNEYGGDIDCRIAWIPDKYRNSEGKADIDSLLAAGVSEDEFDEIVNSAVDEAEFLDSLPDEARDVISGKLARREDRVKFLVRNGCYYVPVVNEKDGSVNEVQVSNFLMSYIATHLTEEGDFHYEFKVTNDENQTNIIRFDGSEFADYKRFRKKLNAYGKFIWMSTSKNLDNLFLEVVPDAMKVVHDRNRIGWDDELKLYFFDNCALDQEGQLIPYGEDGDVKLGDKYYRVERPETRQIVNYPLGNQGSSWQIDSLVEIAGRLAKNYGSLALYDVTSWFVAAVYKPWLFPINRTFPLLGIFGRKNSGKTRLMQWLLSIFYEIPEAISFDSSTRPGLRNQATLLQYLPVWLDEFRNDQKGKSYLDMLRGIYDHNQVIISSNQPGHNRVFKLRSSLILSGEHIPADETGALNQRMITIQLPDKPVGSEFTWFETRYSTFSGILSFLLNKREKYIEAIKAEYFQLLERYRKMPHVEQRIAINYALIHAVSKKILGVDDGMLQSQLEEVFADIRQDDIEIDPLVNMLETCLRYHNAKGVVANVNYAIDVRHEVKHYGKVVVYFNLKSCLEFFNEVLKRQGKTPHVLAQIRRALKDHPWITDEGRNVRIRGGQVKCYTVHLDRCPESLVFDAYNFAKAEIKGLLRARFDSLLEAEGSDEQQEFEDYTGNL